MSKNAVVLKSGVWYTISNFLVRGIGFITTPIFTRLLTQEEFGLYNNYTSWLSILVIIVTLQPEASLISARYEYEEDLDRYVFSMFSLSAVSTLIWWGLTNVFMSYATSFFDMPASYINSMFIYLFFFPAINLFQTKASYFFKYKASVLISLLLSIGGSLLSVAFVILADDKLTARIIGFVAPVFLIGLVIAIYIGTKGKSIRVGYWKYALKIILPFIPHLLSLTVLNSMDRVMITKICGEKETALYSLAYSVAMIITTLLASLNNAFAPWLGEKLAQKEYLQIRTTSKVYILLFAYIAIGVMLVSPEVLLILGGDNYAEAKWVMVPVALGCICQFIYTLFVNVEQFQKKTIGMAFASVSAAILNYILNALLIPHFGYIAAAYTTLAGYLWLLLIHMFLVYRMKMSQVYSYRFVFVVIVASLIIASVVYLLYMNNLVRYTVVILYIVLSFVVAWKNKEKICGFIKNK